MVLRMEGKTWPGPKPVASVSRPTLFDRGSDRTQYLLAEVEGIRNLSAEDFFNDATTGTRAGWIGTCRTSFVAGAANVAVILVGAQLMAKRSSHFAAYHNPDTMGYGALDINVY